jgi:hypothetical protein
MKPTQILKGKPVCVRHEHPQYNGKVQPLSFLKTINTLNDLFPTDMTSIPTVPCHRDEFGGKDSSALEIGRSWRRFCLKCCEMDQVFGIRRGAAKHLTPRPA